MVLYQNINFICRQPTVATVGEKTRERELFLWGAEASDVKMTTVIMIRWSCS